MSVLSNLCQIRGPWRETLLGDLGYPSLYVMEIQQSYIQSSLAATFLTFSMNPVFSAAAGSAQGHFRFLVIKTHQHKPQTHPRLSSCGSFMVPLHIKECITLSTI